MADFNKTEEPEGVSGRGRGFALWRMGFRPFYLLASVFASVSIGLWAVQYVGWLGRPYLQGSMWHAHEMLFGFTLAVVVGFLFTAVRNWSGQPTPTGAPLAALAALWIAGRLLVLTPYAWAAAIVNAAFPLLAAIALALPLVASRNRRNYFFVALLVLLSAAALAVHLSQLGVLEMPVWIGIQIGFDAVLVVMVVMAGRVVPMFTNNGVPGAKATRHPVVEMASLASVFVILAADMMQLRGPAMAAVLAITAIAHLARLWLWRPLTTWRVPLVWVLHVAYLWIVLHFGLRALSSLGLVASSAATHALTVGAIGGLVIGMMTRTARGHTGRPLRADPFDVACYVLILGAALVRVFIPLAFPAATLHSIIFSAVLWSLGFALYALRYWPVLSRPRLDGQPG